MGHMDRYCKSHPDFHAPAHVEVGGKLDGSEYGRRLRESGADTVVVFAKGHYGFSYYPTDVGTAHPGLRKDMVGEIVEGCHAHDVAVVGYLSTFLDTIAVEDHPEWAMRKADGEPVEGRYGRVCVNSAYADDLLIPQGVELIERYDIDEVFFDTMSRFQVCYCDNCRREFGQSLPQGPESENWLAYVSWYAHRYSEFFQRVSARMHAARDLPCAFNWMWSMRDPTTPPETVDGLLGDNPFGAESGSMNCRYWAGTGLPFEFMTGRFVAGLGDWNSGTSTMYRYIAAVSIANGGGFWLIDRMLPDGTLQEESYRVMSEPFQFIRQRLEYVRGAEHVPEIGVLHGWTHLVGPDLRHFPEPDAREERAFPYHGASELLTQYGRHFTGLSEDRLIERAAEYALIIVPGQEFLRQDVAEALERYVRAGGNLLITQSAGAEPLPVVTELAGVRFEGFTEADHGYFPAQGPDEPDVLQRSPFARIRTEGAESLRGYLEPIGGGAPFGHGYAPPGARGDFPSVTINRCGRGRVIYVGAPVFESYHRYWDHHTAAVILQTVDRLLPEPIVRSKAPPNVEIALLRRGDDLVVNLVNHNARERKSNWYASVVQFMPELHNLRLSIRCSPTADRVLRVPAQEELAFEEADGYMQVVVRRLHIMESLLLPGYFGAGD